MAQSVILVHDVPGLGQLGEQHKVKEGYARNYLIPKHLAIFATPDAIKRLERQKGKVSAQRDNQLKTSKDLSEKLGRVGLVFERPLGQAGRLYGSVTPFDIVSEISRQGVTIEKKSVLMNAAIKTVGDHTIRVRLHSQVTVDIPVKVIGLETNRGSKATEEPEEETAEAAE